MYRTVKHNNTPALDLECGHFIQLGWKPCGRQYYVASARMWLQPMWKPGNSRATSGPYYTTLYHATPEGLDKLCTDLIQKGYQPVGDQYIYEPLRNFTQALWRPYE